jgi:hypothetical protein
MLADPDGATICRCGCCWFWLGVALWIVCGILKVDGIIIAANSVSLALLSGILFFKLRGR